MDQGEDEYNNGTPAPQQQNILPKPKKSHKHHHGHHRSKSRTRGTQSLDLPTLAKAQLPPPLSELDPEEDQGGPLNRRIPSYPQIDLVAHHAHQPVPAISVHDDDHVPLQVVGETYVYPVLDEDDEKWNVAGFLIKLAVTFHKYGAPANRVEYNMVEAAKTFGITTINVSVTPTMMMITFGDIDSPKAFSRVIRCDQSIVQCEKLYRVDQLIDDVCERRIGYREAKIRLDEIINLPPRYPAWAKIVAMTASCAGCAPLFFGGSWVELICGACLGIMNGVLDMLADTSPNFARLYEILCAIICSFVATLLNGYLGSCFGAIVLASLVWFLPGITLTLAIRELATKNLMAGTARFFAAILTCIKLGFGIAIGSQIPFWISAPLQPVCDASIAPSAWFSLLFFTMVVAGFNILLDAHFHQWPGMIFVSAMAYVVSALCGLYLPPQAKELIPAIAGFAVGLAGNMYARFTVHPGVIMIFSGMLMLVPGSIGVKSVLAIMIQKDFVSGVSFAFEMIVIGFSITVGSFVANLIIFPKKSLQMKLF